ncbi:MAG: hypothetical protein AAF500_01170 [Myxococcota bacterium]
MNSKAPRRRWLREVLILLATFVVALIVSASMTTFLPEGPARIDHVIFAVVAFPLVWALAFMLLLGAQRRRRAWIMTGAITVAALVPVIGRFVS